MSRRPVSLSALLVSAAVLAGCGTGLEAQTYHETGRQDGASAELAGRTGISVQRLHIAGPATGSTLTAGETAFVTGGLVNNGTSDDALIGASSDVAGLVTVLLNGTATNEVPVPAQGVAPEAWSLALTNLTRDVHVATYVTVTLEFRRGGKVTLQVPVDAVDNGLGERTPAQDPYAEG